MRGLEQKTAARRKTKRVKADHKRLKRKGNWQRPQSSGIYDGESQCTPVPIEIKVQFVQYSMYLRLDEMGTNEGNRTRG